MGPFAELLREGAIHTDVAVAEVCFNLQERLVGVGVLQRSCKVCPFAEEQRRGAFDIGGG